LPVAFDDKEERRVLRLIWKVLLVVVRLEEQRKVESCALIVAKQRKLTRIEKNKFSEQAMDFLLISNHRGAMKFSKA